MHEERAKHGPRVAAAADAYPFDGLNGVHHPLAMRVHAGRAKDAEATITSDP